MHRQRLTVDLSIPQLHGSDLVAGADFSVSPRHRRISGRDLHRLRYAYREALKDLDDHLLRDIGLDLRGV